MSRTKGNSAEREIAHIMEQWWGQFEECKFIRTPLSGGWGGPQLRANFKASGDLMTTAKQFPFTIEVKRRESWAEENLIKCRKSPVWDWWGQACVQAIEMNVVPMLLLRRNRKPWWLMIPDLMVEKISIHCEHPIPISNWDRESLEQRIEDGHWFPVLFDASEFFDTVKPSHCLDDVKPVLRATNNGDHNMATKRQQPSVHTIQMIDAVDINPAPYNPRKITPVKLEALKESLRTHGWVENLLVQKNTNVLIGGHQRLKAYLEICKENGNKPGKVPCVVIDVNDRIAKKLNVTLNRVTGEFDSKKLGDLIGELQRETKLSNEEIKLMGFNNKEIDDFINISKPAEVQVDENLKEFAKSITFSVEFESIEKRDRAKKMLIDRAKSENKRTGDLLLELLNELPVQKNQNHCSSVVGYILRRTNPTP